MSVEDDKVFEDQIERMKQKNQYILEKFQASEEDRKRAENSGATIKKDQNMSIRLKSDDAPKMRNNKSNVPRPKSFHGKCNYDDQAQNHAFYNQFNDNRKQGKFRNSKFNDEEVAYQDYMHFQQAYSNKNSNNYNRSIHRQNSNPNYAEFSNVEKIVHQDFNRFNNQNLRNRSSPRNAQNNYQNTKTSKENDFHSHSYSKLSKENDFHNPNYSKTPKENESNVPNNQKVAKDNESHNYKSNSQKSKETYYKSNYYHDNSSNKKRPRQKNRTNNNKSNVDPSGDSNSNQKKKSPFDDEYINDTLEDLEQYRLKVDMEDFIVIDPESPDPILAMPLKPWTDDVIIVGIDKNETDSKNTESSTDVLNIANERAKEYLNLIVQNNIDPNMNNEINNHSTLEEAKSTETKDNSEKSNSLENELLEIKLREEENKTPVSRENGTKDSVNQVYVSLSETEHQATVNGVNIDIENPITKFDSIDENDGKIQEMTITENITNGITHEDLTENLEKDALHIQTKDIVEKNMKQIEIQ